MPQTQQVSLIRVVQPSGPLGPLPFLHLRPRPLPDFILDELPAAHRQRRREHPGQIVRGRSHMRFIEPEKQRRQRNLPLRPRRRPNHKIPLQGGGEFPQRRMVRDMRRDRIPLHPHRGERDIFDRHRVIGLASLHDLQQRLEGNIRLQRPVMLLDPDVRGLDHSQGGANGQPEPQPGNRLDEGDFAAAGPGNEQLDAAVEAELGLRVGLFARGLALAVLLMTVGLQNERLDVALVQRVALGEFGAGMAFFQAGWEVTRAKVSKTTTTRASVRPAQCCWKDCKTDAMRSVAGFDGAGEVVMITVSRSDIEGIGVKLKVER